MIYFELRKIKLRFISRADVATDVHSQKRASPCDACICVRACVCVCVRARARARTRVISEIKHSFKSLCYLTNYIAYIN